MPQDHIPLIKTDSRRYDRANCSLSFGSFEKSVGKKEKKRVKNKRRRFKKGIQIPILRWKVDENRPSKKGTRMLIQISSDF